MNCPQCGGECYDNREKNAARVAQGQKPMPDFKCKGECGWVQWPPKQPKPKMGTSVPKAGTLTWTDLASTYARCLDICAVETAKLARAHTKLALPSWDNIMAGSATLFIQACKAGLTVVTQRPVPKAKEDFAEPPFEEEPPTDDDTPF